MTFDFPLYNPDPDLTQIYNTNLDPILNSPHKVSIPIQIQNKLKKETNLWVSSSSSCGHGWTRIWRLLLLVEGFVIVDLEAGFCSQTARSTSFSLLFSSNGDDEKGSSVVGLIEEEWEFGVLGED